jgi:hypothetical protein
MIHEFIVGNTQQCATVQCLDGSNVTQRCVAPNTYTAAGNASEQATLQALVDAQAAQQALQDATDALNAAASCLYKSAYICCLGTCNPADGSKTYQYNNNPTLPCVATDINQFAAFLPKGAFSASDQTTADQLAHDSVTSAVAANLLCHYKSVPTWAVATCPNGTDMACTTTKPALASNQVQGFADTGAATSTLSQDQANQEACNLAKSLCNDALKACSIAGQLSGLVWTMPCILTNAPCLPSGLPGGDYNDHCTCCDPTDQKVTLQGSPGTTYQVTLKIRGCVELRDYQDAVGNPNLIPNTNKYCVANIGNAQYPYPGQQHPTANVYTLEISDPPAVYYLNNLDTRVQDFIYRMDKDGTSGNGYQITVPIKAGADVYLKARSIENMEYRANWLAWQAVVPNDDPAHLLNPAIDQHTTATPHGYHGQWLQMDVMTVA